MTEDPMDGLMMTDRDRHELRDIAREMADAARRATLPLFRAPELSAENKRTESFDPVTEADRAAGPKAGSPTVSRAARTPCNRSRNERSRQ